jgi:hypothetical protein
MISNVERDVWILNYTLSTALIIIHHLYEGTRKTHGNSECRQKISGPRYKAISYFNVTV